MHLSNNVVCMFLSRPDLSDSQMNLKKWKMTDQLRVFRESSILPDSFKMIFRLVQVCAVPNYSIDMPPLTLMTVVQIRPGWSLSLHALKTTWTRAQDSAAEREEDRESRIQGGFVLLFFLRWASISISVWCFFGSTVRWLANIFPHKCCSFLFQMLGMP